MQPNRSQRALQHAFRAVTLSLVDAFLRHEAPTQLIQDVGDELEMVFRHEFARAAHARRAR